MSFSFSQPFSIGIEISFESLLSRRLQAKHNQEKRLRRPTTKTPAATDFPISAVTRRPCQRPGQGRSKPPPSCPPAPISASAWHLGGTEQSCTPGRTRSSESRFTTIASKGWNNDIFQNSHGNSSFSLQTLTPLAAWALNKVAAYRGDLKPVFR